MWGLHWHITPSNPHKIKGKQRVLYTNDRRVNILLSKNVLWKKEANYLWVHCDIDFQDLLFVSVIMNLFLVCYYPSYLNLHNFFYSLYNKKHFNTNNKLILGFYRNVECILVFGRLLRDVAIIETPFTGSRVFLLSLKLSVRYSCPWPRKL